MPQNNIPISDEFVDARVRTRPDRRLAIREITVGDQVELTDGTIRTVIENPMDGIWIYLSSPLPKLSEGTELTESRYIKRVVEQTETSQR